MFVQYRSVNKLQQVIFAFDEGGAIFVWVLKLSSSGHSLECGIKLVLDIIFGSPWELWSN